MSDFINKIITVILVFIMLIVTPFIISYKSDEMLGQREILNTVELFIDKVKDTASITEDDMNKLYLDCNSHGITVDVTVKRLIATAVFDDANLIAQTNYFAVDGNEALRSINNGDIVQVQVKELTTSAASKMVYKVVGLDEGKFNFTLAGVVG